MGSWKENRITQWMLSVFNVWRREFHLVFHDEGVLIFFLLLCATYPVLYSLIYNPEMAVNEPIVVVDNCRSELSRKFVRELNATQGISIYDYAANMQDARVLMNKKKCYGILYIPRDFSQCVGRGEQGNVSLYCDMSVLIRYKQMLVAITNVASDIGAKFTTAKIEPFLYQDGAVIESKQVALGNTGMGLASAILPVILSFVLQQSMILGVSMIYGGSMERRRKNKGFDPLLIKAGPAATVLGKAMCYQVVYIILVVYVWCFVPKFFDFPQNADVLDLFAYAMPFILACTFMAQTLQVFVSEREATFLVIAFTSVVFVFLSGVSWPRFDMSRLWYLSGDCVPGTWASFGYVMMQSDGARLHQVAHPYMIMWIQSVVFFILAYTLERFVSRPRYKRMQEMAAADPDALLKADMYRNGVDLVYHDKSDDEPQNVAVEQK